MKYAATAVGAAIAASASAGWAFRHKLPFRISRKRSESRFEGGSIHVATGGMTLGVLDPDALNGVVEEATVQGMKQTVEEIQSEIGLTVDPGSFYLGMLVSGMSHTGCPRPMLMDALRQDERLEAFISRLRTEV